MSLISMSLVPLLLTATLSSLASAHIAAFASGMYCRDGLSGDNSNSNDPIAPLYQLSKTDFWFQHDRGCDARPPPEGEFLELPAGGSFTVQLASNQAFTDLSYNGEKVTQWPDGGDHPDDWHGEWDGAECLPGGGYMHTQNESMAQGTAFAVAYENDLNKITMEDLVVFSVLAHSPWHTSATYQVPAELQACPEGGCTCAWLWVPKGCGQANMYMQPYSCNVTNVDESVAKPLAKAQPAKWCKNDSATCLEGAKQMIVFNSLEDDNVQGVPQFETPVYNEACGFKAGAQEGIFLGSTKPSDTTTTSSTSESSSASVSLTAISSLSTGVHHASSSVTDTTTTSHASSNSSMSFTILPLSTSSASRISSISSTSHAVLPSLSPSTRLIDGECTALTSVVTVTVTSTSVVTSLPNISSNSTVVHNATTPAMHSRWQQWKA